MDTLSNLTLDLCSRVNRDNSITSGRRHVMTESPYFESSFLTDENSTRIFLVVTLNGKSVFIFGSDVNHRRVGL